MSEIKRAAQARPLAKPKGKAKAKVKTRPKKPAKPKAAKTKSIETGVAPWKFLVQRMHPWRKQLYVKGRNLTARQLVGAIKANHFTEEAAAENFRLPIEAIREALAYAEQYAQLLATEAEIERLMSKREETPLVAQGVS
jgi:uncharacterized protein (DUF433 family)